MEEPLAEAEQEERLVWGQDVGSVWTVRVLLGRGEMGGETIAAERERKGNDTHARDALL